MSAKKEYENATLDLRQLIRKGPERLPLFDGVGSTQTAAKPADATPDAPQGGEKFDPEGWRAVSLSDVGLSKKICAALEKHHPSVTTLGEFQQLAAKGEWWHRDVKGIGQSAVDEISDCMEAFWKKHPEFQSTQPAPTEKPAESNG